MASLESLLAWYLGVPPASPGEGVRWQLSTRGFWPEGWPLWLAVLLTLAGLVAIVLIVRQDTRSISAPWGRAGLLALRLASLLIVLGLLCQPVLTVDRTGLPFAAVLIDTSASMGLYDSPKDASPAPRAGATGEALQGTQRLAGVQQLLTKNDSAWLRSLAREHQLRLYHFAETAVPIAAPTSAEATDWPALARSIEGLTPAGLQTRPAPAVRKVLSDLRGTPPAVVVVLTDGVATLAESDRLSMVGDSLRRQAVPLYAIGVGSEIPLQDLQLFDTRLDEVAFVGDPVLIKTRLRGLGLAGQRVQLQVRKGTDETPLVTQEATIPPDGQALPVELTYTPAAAGEEELTIEVVALAQEPDTTNNQEVRPLSVRAEKIRVLLVESVPRYEFRYLKPLLERDPSIELSTLLQDADLGFVDVDRTVIENFPVRRDDLFQYDVIILGDVSPQLLGPAAMEQVGQFVREKGGGLIVVSGPAHLPLELSGTPLEALLPFSLKEVQLPSAEQSVTAGFQPHVTAEGLKGTTLFRFGESDSQTQQIWSRLPAWYWFVRTGPLKPGAMALLEHPTESVRGRTTAPLVPQPLITLQRVGAGKVLYHGTDETWRWRFRVGDEYFSRYWVQAIRLLSRAKLLGRDRIAELTTDRLVYQLGEPVVLRVRFLDEELAAERTSVSIVLEQADGTRQTIDVPRAPQASLVFETTLPPQIPGPWHAWLADPSSQLSPPAADFRIESTSRELTMRSLDRADLEAAARATGGRYVPIDEAERLAEDFPTGAPVTLAAGEPILLWSRWEILALLTLLLSIEWLLRQRLRLL